MGKLWDMLHNKKEEQVETPVEQQNEEVKLPKYNRGWLSRVALHQGFEISDDDKKVDGILGALNRRNGQCPCGGNGAQFECPCVIMRTKGICKCGLFKTIEDRKVTGASSSAKIKTNNE
jgi:ferredoxin-thioredoxin reductase catalytic subunit